jgi:hypothetical protein
VNLSLALTAAAWLALAVPVPAQDGDPPFEVTEPRDRCKHYDAARKHAFFGTTHLHTGLSFDASIRFVDYASGNTPLGAYRFAQKKSSIQLPAPTGRQLPIPFRNPWIDRPLDWGAVTDHSEHFGEMGFCKDILKDDKGNPVPERLSMECRMINGFFYQPGHALNPPFGRTMASNAFTNLSVMNDGAISKNTHLPVCNNHPERCAQAQMKVWEEVRHAAEVEYDRSEDCKFTTFIAYENTSTPLLNNWHRNVIFRNDVVVKEPVTAIDMAVRVNDSPATGGPDGVGEPIDTLFTTVPEDDPRVWPVPGGTPVNHPLPQPFWNKLEADCWKGLNVTEGKASRCDFITIPHNSNLGGGSATFPPLFLEPYNVEDAKRHALMEPLVEIYQDKGSSECRYDPRYLAGTDTIDEFCAFEILDGKTLGSASGVGSGGSEGPEPPDTWGTRSYVRNVWKDGLKYASELGHEGVNPFKMGVVAASDSHTGVMGWHPENEQWPGHLGIDDAYPTSRPETIQNSTGGHSVVWAEENSRDAIFHALKNKETYGTSGTRPIVRFFGGWNFNEQLCNDDFVLVGYADGVPMGGDLPPRTGRAPRFIAAAWKDDFIRTNLQQLQVVKGWVERDPKTEELETYERVYSIAGDPGHPLNAQQAVDPATCKPKEGLGYKQLCQVWEDPDFDPGVRAFYYLRVLEEPVCRYSTLWCRSIDVALDPLDVDMCQATLTRLQNGSADDQLKAAQGAQCCSDQTSVPFIQPVIQERAWTSPIWYTPAGAGEDGGGDYDSGP